MNSGGNRLSHNDDNNGLRLRALEVGLWDYNIDIDILICDNRWYQITGIPINSVNNIADFRPFIHPDDVELASTIRIAEVTELIAQDRRYHVDFRVIRPDGQTRWIRSVACMLIDPDTGHHKALGCITDNTDFPLVNLPLHPGAPASRKPARDRETVSATPAGADAVLSEKELECLSWVSLGKTAWETAQIMGRSQRTVEFHLVNATRKLSASNKIHAAVIAVRRGLI